VCLASYSIQYKKQEGIQDFFYFFFGSEILSNISIREDTDRGGADDFIH
jgi:hypothetical protein